VRQPLRGVLSVRRRCGTEGAHDQQRP